MLKIREGDLFNYAKKHIKCHNYSECNYEDLIKYNFSHCNKKIVFVRHGEGFHNIGINVEIDPILTENGINQAKKLKLKGDIILSSPLDRALETTIYLNYNYMRLISK